jgi:hypothetical protein
MENIKNLRNLIIKSFTFLTEPKKNFVKLKEKKFETVLTDYLTLVFIFGLFAGVVYFLYSLGKAYYLDIFYNVYVDYIRLANYSLGNSAAVLFFYFFAATFLVTITSLIINSFMKKTKLTETMKVVMYSTLPLIFFGWIPTSVWAMSIWTLFLLITGLKTSKQKMIDKHSIQQRD